MFGTNLYGSCCDNPNASKRHRKNNRDNDRSFWKSIKYSFFWQGSKKIIDEARIGIAQSIGAKETEIIFTSGGTEADNYAIFGVAEANSEKGKSYYYNGKLNIMPFYMPASN